MSRSNKKKSRGKPKSNLSEEMQQCYDCLKAVMSKHEASPFLEPVDWKLYGLPDYPEIIKNPMDLGTIEKSLFAGKFTTADDFAKEVRLVWANAQTYNRRDSDIYKTSENLSKVFERKFQKLSKATKKTTTQKRKRNGDSQREVTRGDRVKFSNLVNQLSSEELGHIVQILVQQCPGCLHEEEKEIDIEVNNIDSNTLLEINDYARNCVARKMT